MGEKFGDRRLRNILRDTQWTDPVNLREAVWEQIVDFLLGELDLAVVTIREQAVARLARAVGDVERPVAPTPEGARLSPRQMSEPYSSRPPIGSNPL